MRPMRSLIQAVSLSLIQVTCRLLGLNSMLKTLFTLICLCVLLCAGRAEAQRTLTDSSTITWDFDTPGEVTGHVVPSMLAYFSGGTIVKDGTNCLPAVETTINSGPKIPVFTCADSGSSIFQGSTWLPIAITTATFTLGVSDVDSSSHVFAGDFSAMCRANDAAINSTWGTGVAVSITMTTANDIFTVESSAVTPNGTCSANSWLFWRFVVNATSFTDDGDARVIGVGMEAQ